jgi:alkaline phosphatase
MMETDDESHDYGNQTERTTLLGRALHSIKAHKCVFIVVGVILIISFVALVVSMIVLFSATHRASTATGPLNVILMLSDGMGPASISMARAYRNATQNVQRLFVDDYLSGSVQTASLDSRITDSAAGATSYACGTRTFNNKVRCVVCLESFLH